MKHNYPTPLVVGNWKMNGLLALTTALVQALVVFTSKNKSHCCEVVICPPATMVYPAAELLRNSIVALGGQDCHPKAQGAYTGDISPLMLKELNCRYVIVGHSERRQYHNENNDLVRQKAESAINAGLIPIICIGESEEERQAGHFLSAVMTQLAESIPTNSTPENTVIAYEPVWAIGTGKVPVPHEIAEVHLALTNHLPNRFRLLYGGSVKPANTQEILSIPYVDGLLVGGCSLNVDDFLHIIQSASIEVQSLINPTNT